MTDRTWRVVTPEAVALDLDAAGLGSRVLAALLDGIALYAALTALLTVLTMLAGIIGSGVIVTVVLIFVFFAALLAWPVAWEVATHGRSIGKMAFGLRVVTVEGAPIRFRHALVRGLLNLFEVWMTFGAVALLVALCSRRFRRLGDHLAGTVVVRERTSTTAAVAVRFLPLPGWEQWSSALDVSRLTSDHHRLIRAYLLRAKGLDVVTRVRLGGQILDELVTVHTLTAAGRAQLQSVDPVLPLTAVAAAYQRRFSPDPIMAPLYAFAPGVAPRR